MLPWPQHWLPQQVLGPASVGAQGVALWHEAGWQVAPMQTSPAPQGWPQLPQFCVSVSVSTQRSPQH
jgi:hypothetical protein